VVGEPRRLAGSEHVADEGVRRGDAQAHLRGAVVGGDDLGLAVGLEPQQRGSHGEQPRRLDRDPGEHLLQVRATCHELGHAQQRRLLVGQSLELGAGARARERRDGDLGQDREAVLGARGQRLVLRRRDEDAPQLPLDLDRDRDDRPYGELLGQRATGRVAVVVDALRALAAQHPGGHVVVGGGVPQPERQTVVADGDDRTVAPVVLQPHEQHGPTLDQGRRLRHHRVQQRVGPQAGGTQLGQPAQRSLLDVPLLALPPRPAGRQGGGDGPDEPRHPGLGVARERLRPEPRHHGQGRDLPAQPDGDTDREGDAQPVSLGSEGALGVHVGEIHPVRLPALPQSAQLVADGLPGAGGQGQLARAPDPQVGEPGGGGTRGPAETFEHRVDHPLAVGLVRDEPLDPTQPTLQVVILVLATRHRSAPLHRSRPTDRRGAGGAPDRSTTTRRIVPPG
jgi:hypothetical protein